MQSPGLLQLLKPELHEPLFLHPDPVQASMRWAPPLSVRRGVFLRADS